MGLTRSASVTGLDVIGIPICMALLPNSRSLPVFQGKGLNLAHRAEMQHKEANMKEASNL